MRLFIVKLINEWNPIEIYPLLENEYLSEINKIIDFVEKNEDISYVQLAEFLEQTFIEAFNEKLYLSNKRICEEIAIKIIREKEHLI